MCDETKEMYQNIAIISDILAQNDETQNVQSILSNNYGYGGYIETIIDLAKTVTERALSEDDFCDTYNFYESVENIIKKLIRFCTVEDKLPDLAELIDNNLVRN